MKLLSEAGFDPVYGARPLNCNPAAYRKSVGLDILTAKFQRGDMITAELEDGVILFQESGPSLRP